MANKSDAKGEQPQDPVGPEPRFVPPLRADPSDVRDAPQQETNTPPAAPPEAGDTVAARYRLESEIGRGAHGRVFLAFDTSRGNERVAVKICPAPSELPDEETQEAAHLLHWFRHPNWADIFDAGVTQAGFEFQVARLVEGRSLDTFRGPQPIEFVMRFLEDAADVLDAVHRHGIIHYDVTPANFVVEQGPRGLTFVLTDGGLARVGAMRDGGRGSPLFMAPELTVEGEHDQRVDLYSLGLVAFRLATGSNPIEGGAGEVLGERRRTSAPSARQRRNDLPKDLDQLIASLLDREPNRRPADARALARRVEEIRGNSGRTQELIIAHQTREGPLVGRDDVMKSLEHSLERLARSPATSPGARVNHDAVVLVHGPSGVGCTRVALEILNRARQHKLPVLTLVGSHVAHMSADPLDHVMQQLDAVLAGGGGTPRPRRPRQRSHDAMVERLLRQWERVARECPFVMVVTDYKELSASLKRAVHVISRFLVARRDQSRTRPAIPTTLVVDLGNASPDPLLNPDAEDRRAPVTTLAPLSAHDTERLVATRFPGFALESRERAMLHARSGGLPRDIVALVGEAGRRGDFTPAEGSWTWRVQELDRYPALRPLDPAYLQAWDALPAESHTVLQALALAREPLSQESLKAACGSEPVTVARQTPLVKAIETEHGTSLALVSRGVRELASDSATPDVRTGLAQRLLDVHARHSLPLAPLPMARLLAIAGSPRDAIEYLEANTTGAREHVRMKNFDWVRSLVAQHPELLDEATLHASLLLLLPRSPATIDLATSLSTRIDPSIAGYDTVLNLAKVLHREHRYEECLDLLKRHEPTWPADAKSRAQFQLERSKALLSLRRIDDAKASLRLARHALHQLPGRGRNESDLMGSYMMLLGAFRQLQDDPTNAEKVWTLARNVARQTRRLGVLADALNNLGISRHRRGDYLNSTRLLKRALRLYRGMSKMSNVARAEYNLGTIDIIKGNVAPGIRRIKSSADISLRYGHLQRLSSALVSLAHAYDQELNPTLASATLQRALREALVSKSELRISRISQRLAPLSAAIGDRATMRYALALSGLTSRASQVGRLRHNLAASTAFLFQGDRRASQLYISRASRHATVARPLDHQILGIVKRLLGVDQRLGVATVALDSQSRHLQWCVARLSRPSVYEPLSSLESAPSPESGSSRRLKSEVVFWATSQDCPISPESIEDLGLIITKLTRSSETSHLSRALAIQSTLDRSLSPRVKAQRWSQAVQELQKAGHADYIPREFTRAYDRHATQIGAMRRSSPTRAVSFVDLEAMAYRLTDSVEPDQSGAGRVSQALKRVVQATADLRADHDLYRLLRTMTESVLEVTGAERACVVRVAEDGGQEICVASNAMGGGTTSPSIVNLSQTVIDRVMKTRAPLLLHDVFDDDELMMRPSITKLSLRTLLCVPMVRSGHLYGVLYADSTSTAASFDHVDLEVFTLFADHAAGALESQHLVSNLQQSMRELRRAQDQLIRGERLRTIGEISSGVAHEFNNLLTSILARVQLLSMTPMGSDVARDLELIEKACMDAAEVVRRLQSFSRQECEAGFVTTDLGEICRDAVEFLRPLWTQRNERMENEVTVEIDVPAVLPLNGSPTELREVITNLLKNSIDAINEGGRIKICAVRSGADAVVSVLDDGPGCLKNFATKYSIPSSPRKGSVGRAWDCVSASRS